MNSEKRGTGENIRRKDQDKHAIVNTVVGKLIHK